MNKEENIWIDKQCPFYWKNKNNNGGFLGKVMDEKTRKCILRQTKSNVQGEPGCVYHGSTPPVCDCLGKYRFTDMKKIGAMLWKCPRCQSQITGEKDTNGYNSYDYCQYKGCHK